MTGPNPFYPMDLPPEVWSLENYEPTPPNWPKGVKVYRAAAQDFASIAKLLSTTFPDHRSWSAERVSRELLNRGMPYYSRGTFVVCPERREFVIGCATLRERLGQPEIAWVAVDSRHRGQGHGRNLVRAALELHHKLRNSFGGRDPIAVLNPPTPVSCSFWYSLGFRQVGPSPLLTAVSASLRTGHLSGPPAPV